MIDLGPLCWSLAALAAYGAGVRAVARHRGRAWPRARTAAFVAGVAVGLAVLSPPLDARADERLSAHMLQHLALMLVAAPLVVLGAPLSLALQALRRRPRARLAAVVRSGATRALTHPLTAWTLFAAVTIGTHLTGIYDRAARDDAVHALEHALYLGAALLFWLPLLGANPVRRLHSWLGRTFYLLLAMPPMSVVSALLVYSPAPRYPAYVAAAREHGFSAIADQQDAGAYMWVGGSLVLAAAAVALGWQALVREERRQRVLDALEAGS